MGWDSLVGANRKETIADLRSQYQRNGFTILADAAAPGSAAQFFAVEKEGKSFIIVALTEKSKGEWYVKDFPESSGPFETRCPEKLLNLTEGLDSEQSKKWREGVREYHQRKNQTFEPGDVVSINNGEKQYLVQGPYKKGSYLIQDNKGKTWKGITADLTLIRSAKERYS